VVVLLDTNILGRYVVASDPAHASVTAALLRLQQTGSEIRICSQNLYEFWSVATRGVEHNGLGMSPAEARTEVDRLRSAFAVLAESPSLLEVWLDLCTKYGTIGRSAHDARLVALMLVYGIQHVLTLDPGGFRRYTEINVLTPAEI
jgi:predicted nucleic acid-binding protein